MSRPKCTLILTSGAEYPCRVSPIETYVVAPGSCPVCAGKSVLIAHDIRQTAIFEESKRERAIAHLRNEGARTWEDVPPATEFRVRGGLENRKEYSTEADAHCVRCHHHVGRLVVPLDTLFGRSEDDLILSGQYGMVIAASGRHA